MKKEELIKEIDDAINCNRMSRIGIAENLMMYRDSSQRSNDVLAKARHYIKNSGDYERGLEDAWKMAKLIVTDEEKGVLSNKDILDIYGCQWQNVFSDYTAYDALTAYNEWLEEKKKKEEEEEAAKPKLGDVVEVRYEDERHVFHYFAKGIYIKETDTTHNLLLEKGDVFVIRKDCINSINKTGEHVDILGVF